MHSTVRRRIILPREAFISAARRKLAARPKPEEARRQTATRVANLIHEKYKDAFGNRLDGAAVYAINKILERPTMKLKEIVKSNRLTRDDIQLINSVIAKARINANKKVA